MSIDFLPQINGFTHFLAALVLLARLGDVVSTRLVTPRLLLEANPVARWLGWPFALATLFLAVIPYFDAGIGVALLAVSLLVSASNFYRGWFVRAIGEEEFEQLVLRAARRGRRAEALGFVIASGTSALIAGVVLMWLSGASSWGYWFGFGIVIYGFAIGGHGSLYVLRVFRRAAVPE